MSREDLSGQVTSVDNKTSPEKKIPIIREGASGAQDLAIQEQKASARKAMLEKMDLEEVYELFELYHKGEHDISADKITTNLGNHYKNGKEIKEHVKDREMEIVKRFEIEVSTHDSKYDSDIGYLIKEKIIDSLLESADQSFVEKIQQTANDYGESKKEGGRELEKSDRKLKLPSGYRQEVETKVVQHLKKEGLEIAERVKRRWKTTGLKKEPEEVQQKVGRWKMTALTETDLNQRDTRLDQIKPLKMEPLQIEVSAGEMHTRSKANKMVRSFAKNVAKIGSNVRKNVVSAVERVLNRKKGKGVGGPGGGL